MIEPSTLRKWKCEYCTYENYPATKKCTLCRAPKPPQFINEDAPPPEQDIYKLARLVSSPTQETSNENEAGPLSSPTSASSRPDMIGNKWPCQVCTFLNWPKSQKCTQCLTSRPKVVPVVSHSKSQDHMKPLSISVNIESAGTACKNSPRTSPRTSPNSPEQAKALNNDKNKAVAAASKGSKWTCKACTYENWPKTSKCILCGIPKGKTYTAASTSSGSKSPTSDGECSNRSLQKRRSPPASAKFLDSIEIQQLGGATASPNIYQEKQDKNTREERRLRQFRNRLRELDWLWLNACNGVVEGDTHAVEAYLSAGGDSGRQISQDESSFLNRPSAFQLGYTLVHLAIRFQREDMLAVLLTATDVAAKAKKRVPSHISPDLAADILREVAASLRQRKGDFPCLFVTECTTFTLPAGKPKTY